MKIGNATLIVAVILTEWALLTAEWLYYWYN